MILTFNLYSINKIGFGGVKFNESKAIFSGFTMASLEINKNSKVERGKYV